VRATAEVAEITAKVQNGQNKRRRKSYAQEGKVAAAKIGDCDWKMRICRVSIYQTIKL